MFTLKETKLINVVSALKRKQKGLRCDVLSQNSIRIVWMSAFGDMHDLCLKNLINITTNNLAENAVREYICYLVRRHPTESGRFFRRFLEISSIMSASEAFIQAIQTGDLLYVQRHLKRPVSIPSVVQTVRTKSEWTRRRYYGCYWHLPLFANALMLGVFDVESFIEPLHSTSTSTTRRLKKLRESKFLTVYPKCISR